MRHPRHNAPIFASLILLAAFAAAAIIIVTAPGHKATPASAATGTEAPALATPRLPAVGTPNPNASSAGGNGRGYLGIGVESVNATTNQQFQIHGNSGAVVVSVQDGGAASRAGVHVGDVITAVDGQTVATVQDLTNVLSGDHAGQQVRLTVMRGQTQKTVEVRLGATAPSLPSNGNLPSISSGLLGPLISALSGTSLSHFVSADITVKTASGSDMTLHVIGGTVKTATSAAVTIAPNSGGADQRFQISASTRIDTGLGTVGGGSLPEGTHVLVITQNTSTVARQIIALVGASGQPPQASGQSPVQIRPGEPIQIQPGQPIRIQVPFPGAPQATPTPAGSVQ